MLYIIYYNILYIIFPYIWEQQKNVHKYKFIFFCRSQLEGEAEVKRIENDSFINSCATLSPLLPLSVP